MTPLLVVMALPFTLGVALSAFVLGPLIYRAGARSVQRATARDNAEIARILDGLHQTPEPLAITGPRAEDEAIWARPAPAALRAPTAAHGSLRVATSARSLNHQPRHARPALVMAHLAADTSALGYRRLVTYTQVDESGASLRAAGYRVLASRPPRSGWSCPSRPREDRGADGIARTQPFGKWRREL